MPKTTHTVTLPDGQTAKRVSQFRVYTHVVVGRRRLAFDLARAHAAGHQKQDRKEFLHQHQRAAGLPGDYFVSRYDDLNAKWLEEAKLFVAEHTNVEVYVAARLAERLAQVEADRVAGKYEAWHALTWASRLDLAHRARGAAEWQAYETDVLPTQVVTKG